MTLLTVLPSLRTNNLKGLAATLTRDLALRYAEGSAPAPVAPTAQQGNPGKFQQQLA
jgi:hypothetical protein